MTNLGGCGSKGDCKVRTGKPADSSTPRTANGPGVARPVGLNRSSSRMFAAAVMQRPGDHRPDRRRVIPHFDRDFQITGHIAVCQRYLDCSRLHFRQSWARLLRLVAQLPPLETHERCGDLKAPLRGVPAVWPSAEDRDRSASASRPDFQSAPDPETSSERLRSQYPSPPTGTPPLDGLPARSPESALRRRPAMRLIPFTMA